MLNELPGAELILPGLDDLHQGETHHSWLLANCDRCNVLESLAGPNLPNAHLAP